MDSDNIFGKKVMEARKRVGAGMTRHDLAIQLKAAGIDVSEREVALIESGKRTLNYYEMTLLASVLKTTVRALYSTSE